MGKAEHATMQPFRIAILIFAVGASVANYFAAREYWDRIAASTPLASSTAAPTDSPGLIDWRKYAGTANEQPTPVTPDPATASLRAEAKDKAWMREAVVLTIAGVAWFLLPSVKKRAE